MTMKTRLLLIALIPFFTVNNFAQTIWNGPTITFNKPNNADWTLQANQDRITSNVWITRKNTQGIFNINQELGYSSTSPMDTEWAFGTTSNLGSLTFASWVVTNANNPPGMVGLNMVVHLISEDIYIDIKFTYWSIGGLGGGGFSYERSTNSGLSIKDDALEKFSIVSNPNDQNIKLIIPSSVKSASVQIFNILGEEVYAVGAYLDPINVSTWAKGIYLIKLKSESISQTKKFIKN